MSPAALKHEQMNRLTRWLGVALTCFAFVWPCAAQPETESDGAEPAGARVADEMTADEAVAALEELFDQVEAGEWEGADATLRDLIQRPLEVLQTKAPDHPRLPFYAARTAMVVAQHRAAQRQLEAYIDSRAGRNDWRARRLLGDVMLESYPQLARAHYDKAAELKPNEPSVLYGLARCASRRGRKDEALDFARRAVSADGEKNPRYLTLLAQMLQSDGQHAEARRAAEKALAIAQRRAEAQPGRRGPLQLLDHQYDVAIRVVRAGEGELPAEDAVTLAGYLRQRNDVIAKLRLHDIASMLGVAVAQAGDRASIALLLEYGRALAEIDRQDEAIETFKRVLARDAENQAANEWLDRLTG